MFCLLRLLRLFHTMTPFSNNSHFCHPRYQNFFLLNVFIALTTLTSIAIGSTLWVYPLFPLRPDSLAWSNTWLVATVVDYYGACLPFCVVILSSEKSWTSGVLWSTACCLLGSPFISLWCIHWLWKHRHERSLVGLRLATTSREGYEPVSAGAHGV